MYSSNSMENSGNVSPEEWDLILSEVAAADGTTLILGGVDVGKTTFTRMLVNRIVAQGKRIAVLDLDLGQSEIGPPGCVGLGWTDTPVRALSEIAPQALAFVGATSPPGFLLEYLTGARRLADLANRPLVIDSCGMIQGGSARRMHQAQVELLRPEQVVALQRQGEMEALLAPIRRAGACRIYMPPVPEAVTRKAPAYRTQRRAMRFAAYFHGASLHTYAFSEVTFLGTWLGRGLPLPAHEMKFLNECVGPNARVYHAEMCDRHLGLMASRPLYLESPGLSMAQQHLRTRSISVTVAPRLKHLLLGLEAEKGKLLGLGVLEAIDFRRGTMGVLTPVRAPAAAKLIRMGSLRVSPEGVESGTLRADELQ